MILGIFFIMTKKQKARIYEINGEKVVVMDEVASHAKTTF